MRILALPGDGIGPEITAATLAVLAVIDDRLGLGLEVEQEPIGFASLDAHGTTLRDEVVDRVRAVDGTILGPVSHFDYPARERGGRQRRRPGHERCGPHQRPHYFSEASAFCAISALGVPGASSTTFWKSALASAVLPWPR